MKCQRSIPEGNPKYLLSWPRFFEIRKTWSFHVIVWQRTAKKCTKICNARTQLLFCSLNLLFGDVHVAVAVVVYLRPRQTRTHCCGHSVADTNVSPFVPARNICCGLKFCFRDTKNVSDFVQKHSVSATNVSQFAQPKKHHGQQCVRNNVSSFTRALKFSKVWIRH